MSENIPSQNEEPICRCKALYLGTSVFNPTNKKLNESTLNLSQLQETIAERYPNDGSNFAKGIQTWLTIFPSGIQMEHASSKDLASISALFYYPIKSLVYCGALRFIEFPMEKRSRSWQFVPLDTDLAQKNENFKNPPLFVVFLKGIDPNTKKQVVECQVFVVGMVKTAMKLIESCQKAFNGTKETVGDFFKKFGNIPVVYCMKTDLNNSDKRVLIKKFDEKGYFYATENTPIDVWQLFEENELLYETMSRQRKKSQTNEGSSRVNTREISEQIYSEVKHTRGDYEKKTELTEKTDVIELSNPKPKRNEQTEKNVLIDPYEKSDNLIKVEKRVDPVTGQNIYVRYLADPCQKPKTYDLPNQVYESETDAQQLCESEDDTKKHSSIIIRQEKTPSPIIVEKYIKKKAPQVIIKEIHVHEPAPPPVKIIQNMDNQFDNENIDYDPRNRPPNILGPRAIGYPSVNTLPRPGPKIRIVNSSNAPGNNGGYTDVRNLINKAYGYPGFEYNIENQYPVDRYPVYMSANRNYVFNSHRNGDIDYRKLPNDVYDYRPKTRKIVTDISVNPINYSSLRHNELKRHSTSYPRKDVYDKYQTTRPSNSRKVYTDHPRNQISDQTSKQRPKNVEHDVNKSKMYHRNSSLGRVDERHTYKY